MKVKDLVQVLSQIEEDDLATVVFEQERTVDFTSQHAVTGVAYNNGSWFITVEVAKNKGFK